MRDKAMPLGKKFKVRLTIAPEETGTPVDMLGFTFTSGRNGTRSWVLATHDGDSIRRIRLSRNELGDLEDILQSIANEEKELRGGR